MSVALTTLGGLQIVDPSQTIIRGYAAVFGNPFKYFDPFEWRERTFVIAPGAFTSAIERIPGPLPIHWRHQEWELQIGETSRLEQDSYGLYFEGRPFGTSGAVDVLGVLAGRSRTGASIGFEFGEKEEQDDGTELLLSFSELIELGPCPRGANPLAYAELTAVPADANAEPEPAINDVAGAALADSIRRATARLRRRF